MSEWRRQAPGAALALAEPAEPQIHVVYRARLRFRNLRNPAPGGKHVEERATAASRALESGPRLTTARQRGPALVGFRASLAPGRGQSYSEWRRRPLDDVVAPARAPQRRKSASFTCLFGSGAFAIVRPAASMRREAAVSRASWSGPRSDDGAVVGARNAGSGRNLRAAPRPATQDSANRAIRPGEVHADGGSGQEGGMGVYPAKWPKLGNYISTV